MRVLLPALLSIGLAGALVIADDVERAPPLTTRYEVKAQLPVEVPEISGLCVLPGGDAAHRTFLAVSDDARGGVDAPVVREGLYRVTFRVGEADAVTVEAVLPVTLHCGALIPHMDPLWASLGGWRADLESCVVLPGTTDLFLLGGERGAEDASDGGANRLYVVRYPAGADDRADLVAYFRLPDTDDDTINDRFEAVAALPGAEADTWTVFAMKERTPVADRTPTYFPLRLRRTEKGFELALQGAAPRERLPTLDGDPRRLSSQADAVVAPNGAVWVLDRWRREIHVAGVADGRLRLDDSFDYFDVVEDVSGETSTTEPAAPGSSHVGYGRHEAIAFDALGWLWLAADLGGGNPSVVTALAPKKP